MGMQFLRESSHFDPVPFPAGTEAVIVVWKKFKDQTKIELNNKERKGVDYLVYHPGDELPAKVAARGWPRFGADGQQLMAVRRDSDGCARRLDSFGSISDEHAEKMQQAERKALQIWESGDGHIPEENLRIPSVFGDFTEPSVSTSHSETDSNGKSLSQNSY